MNAQVARVLTRTDNVRPAKRTTDLPLLDSFKVEHHSDTNLTWVSRRARSASYVTVEQLIEAELIDTWLHQQMDGRNGIKVLASEEPGRYSLGGDLAYFIDCIEQQDASRLAKYANLAVGAIYRNLVPDSPGCLATIALVSGEAQGGGFEAALSCHLIVAERGVNFGFPESLFGLFPGMGAMEMLTARVGADVAARLVCGANRYSAEFLFELGVVDYLVEPDSGRHHVEHLAKVGLENDTLDRQKLLRRRAQLRTVSREVLLSSVNQWREQALGLAPSNIRRMKYILEMQQRSSHVAK